MAQDSSCELDHLETFKCNESNLNLIEMVFINQRQIFLEENTGKVFTDTKQFDLFREEVKKLARTRSWIRSCKKSIPEYRFKAGSCMDLFPSFWKVYLKTSEVPVEYRLTSQEGWFHQYETSAPPEDACVVEYDRKWGPFEAPFSKGNFGIKVEEKEGTVSSSFTTKGTKAYQRPWEYYQSMGEIDESQHHKQNWFDPAHSLQIKRKVVAGGAFELRCDQRFDNDFDFTCSFNFRDLPSNKLSPGSQLHVSGETRKVVIKDQDEAYKLWEMMKDSTNKTSRQWKTPAGDSALTCTQETAKMPYQYHCEASYNPPPKKIREY